MALYVALKFSQEEMPKVFDPGVFQDLQPQDFVVVPRGSGEDVAFVATLEHKSVQSLKLRPEPYPRVLRRASEQEVEAWWLRKQAERRAFIVCKEKAREMNLDIKISHARCDMKENKAIFHFTSEQRVDFRNLVKDLGALLKMRIELWQIGVRDEARLLDGFGVCGLQTCCSTWLTEFRPITIKMAKDQDINLPPAKLSGQCGRLLCCLSYEVDQYREMTKGALPKGATVKWGDGKQGVIVDRNLVAATYLVAEEGVGLQTIKAEELVGEARVPDQMRRQGKKFGKPDVEPVPEVRVAAEPILQDPTPAPPAMPPVNKPRHENRKRPETATDFKAQQQRRQHQKPPRDQQPRILENAADKTPDAEPMSGGSVPLSAPGEDQAPGGAPRSGRRKKKRGRR
ncbi:hypothetical protein BH09SUM1_BH09SUM1_28980 [soil metagenome]